MGDIVSPHSFQDTGSVATAGRPAGSSPNIVRNADTSSSGFRKECTMTQNPSNPFRHPSRCNCDSCREWREDQIDLEAAGQGMELLGKMKDMKRASEPWTCEHCGRSVSGIRDSCSKCGAGRPAKQSKKSLKSTSHATMTIIMSGGDITILSEKKFCGNCGTKLPHGAAYCPECGTKV